MKGKVSRLLESVLRDSSARQQLRDSLINGKDGRVTVGGETYTVRIEVRRTLAAAPAPTRRA